MQNLSCFTCEVIIIIIDCTEFFFYETECCKWLDVLWKQLIPHVLTAFLSKTPLPNDIYWSIFGSDSTNIITFTGMTTCVTKIALLDI